MTTTKTITSLLLILLTQQTLANDESDFDPAYLCTIIPNGTKIKDPRFCNIYIECMNLEPITHTCDSQFFDRNAGQCVDAETVNCISTNPCASKPNGFVADPYACSGYYYCTEGVPSRGQCSSGFNYHASTEYCLKDLQCDIKLYPNDYCNIMPDGVRIKDLDTCGYKTCWFSEMIDGNCPYGSCFNAVKDACDYSHYYNKVNGGQ